MKPAIFILALFHLPAGADTFEGPFRIETRSARKITFVYTVDAQTPDKLVDKWVINMPVPPDTGSQRVERVDFVVKSLPAAWTRPKDKSHLERELASTILIADGGSPAKIVVDVTYSARMSERRLKPGKPADPVPDLPADQARLFTRPTPTCDYREPSVQRWIEKHDLTKRKGETELQFAFRTFQAVQKFLRYELPNTDADFFRCSRSVRTGKADCGASNLLLCGVLRNSGIPARVYCGRWILNPKPGDSHSRGEFFARGIGWVPVDATAPQTPGGDARKNFGTDPAQYFATSLETDWQIDLPVYGVQKLTWLHQYVVPYRHRNQPTWDGFRLREAFKLTER